MGLEKEGEWERNANGIGVRKKERGGVCSLRHVEKITQSRFAPVELQIDIGNIKLAFDLIDLILVFFELRHA